MSLIIQHHRYLFFVTKPYSFAVLEPLQDFIRNNTPGEVRWFTAGKASAIAPPGEKLSTTAEVKAYNPDAVIIPGNVVPHFWPGLKVQIFHGLGEEKKGHYDITGFFDLYCTPGLGMTRRFTELAAKHKHFIVAQTGWPKLDPLAREVDRPTLQTKLALTQGRPVLLYAPTFSPKYTSAKELLPIIKTLMDRRWQWLIKFHDLMNNSIVNEYRALQNSHLKIVTAHNIIPLMQVSDLLITDTSSVAYEYLLLDRPIITYKATTRKDKGINLNRPGLLSGAIERSLAAPAEFSQQRKKYLDELHPYTDGQSSRRVVESIENVLQNGLHLKLKRKPLNLLRKMQIRRILSL